MYPPTHFSVGTVDTFTAETGRDSFRNSHRFAFSKVLPSKEAEFVIGYYDTIIIDPLPYRIPSFN